MLEICIVVFLLMLWLHWGCVHVSTSVIHCAPSDTSSPTHIWVTLQARQGACAFSILYSGENIFAWLPVYLQLNSPVHTAVISTDAPLTLYTQVVSGLMCLFPSQVKHPELFLQQLPVRHSFYCRVTHISKWPEGHCVYWLQDFKNGADHYCYISILSGLYQMCLWVIRIQYNLKDGVSPGHN